MNNKYSINKFKASTEEWYIYQYLLELKENNIVKEINFQPKPFKLFEGLEKRFYKIKQLKTKVSKQYYTKQYLINPHIYTPDFKIIWNVNKNSRDFIQSVNLTGINTKIPFLVLPILNNENQKIIAESYLEVKGSFDRNNMTRMFSDHIQPLIWNKYQIYIQLVKPIDLFKQTFIPEKIKHSFYYSKTGKWGKVGDKKFKWQYRTFKEFINIKTKQS